MSGTTTRAPVGAAIKIPPPYCGSIRRPGIEPLSPAMHGTWPETIQAPAADAIAVEHAQAPGCDQLRTIWPASPAAARRDAMTRTPTAAFVRGRHGRGRPGCQRSCRPGKAPGTRSSAGASGRFARGSAHEPG
jgi:hypothetical protein